MKICPKCGGQWPDKANFCPKDGSQLVQQAAPRPPQKRKPKEKPPDAPEPGLEDWEQDTGEGMPEGFSETQWFMAAKEPDELKEDPTSHDLLDLQGKYERDESIPEDERRKFTLRGKKKEGE